MNRETRGKRTWKNRSSQAKIDFQGTQRPQSCFRCAPIPERPVAVWVHFPICQCIEFWYRRLFKHTDVHFLGKKEEEKEGHKFVAKKLLNKKLKIDNYNKNTGSDQDAQRIDVSPVCSQRHGSHPLRIFSVHVGP